MTARKDSLSQAEIANAFKDQMGEIFPPILSLEDVARLLRRSTKTVREWMNKGYFAGCFRKRGKRLSFWRDRVVELFFNGPEWEY
jgi:hypothetical protein